MEARLQFPCASPSFARVTLCSRNKGLKGEMRRVLLFDPLCRHTADGTSPTPSTFDAAQGLPPAEQGETLWVTGVEAEAYGTSLRVVRHPGCKESTRIPPHLYCEHSVDALFFMERPPTVQ
ncbi:hypothetical protein MTO96_001028 [Rhipicephalus appendiculatus]